MEYTTNLNLKKPDINEYYNIVEQENENADIIDEAIGKLNSDVGTEELTTEAQDCKGAINELNKKIPQLKITEVSGTTDSRGRINTDFDISDKIIVGLLSHHNGDFCLQYRMSANTLGVDFLNSADFSPIANSSRSANVYYMDMPY